MERMSASKQLVVFVYLSIVLHFYLLLLAGVMADKDIISMLRHPNDYRRDDMKIENIIVDSVSSSQKPLQGYISENANAASAPQTGERAYNLFNPDMAPRSGANGSQDVRETDPADRNAQNGREQQELPEDPNGLLQIPENNRVAAAGTPSPSVVNGNPATTYYDPSRDMQVVMDSRGDISLPTVPQEFAAYFSKMGQKIADNWQRFFPVFQYYQGILKSGSIQVVIQLDRDGNIVNTSVVNSFGYNVVDEALLNAIRYSQNFGSPPENLLDGFRDGLSPEDRAKGDIVIGFKYIFVAQENRTN